MSPGPNRACQEAGCDRAAAPGDARCALHLARFGSLPLGDGPETPRPAPAAPLSLPTDPLDRKSPAPYLSTACVLLGAATAAGVVPLAHLAPSPLEVVAFNAAPVLLAGGVASAIVSVRRSVGRLAHGASWVLLIYALLWVIAAWSLFATTSSP